jgi:hypothetical protein
MPRPSGLRDASYPDCPTDDCHRAPLVRSPRGRRQVKAYAIALEGIQPALKRCAVPNANRVGNGRHDLLASEPRLFEPDRDSRSFSAFTTLGNRSQPGLRPDL